MQRSFHSNQPTISGMSHGGPAGSHGLIDQSLLYKKNNHNVGPVGAPTSSTVIKGSVTSSPTNMHIKKS
jgi:hypothetical protein